MDIVVKIKQCLLFLFVVGGFQLMAMELSEKFYLENELLACNAKLRIHEMVLDCHKKRVNAVLKDVSNVSIAKKNINQCTIVSQCDRKMLEAVFYHEITDKKSIEVQFNKQKDVQTTLLTAIQHNNEEVQRGQKRELEEDKNGLPVQLPTKRARTFTDRYAEYKLSLGF